MRATWAALALLASAGAHAEGFVDASVGAAWREPDDDKPYDQLGLEYDTGTVARLEVGTQYETGLQLRVGYAFTAYDALKADTLTIAEDIQQQEVRIGVFHATPRGKARGWRLGGGYVYADEDSDGGGDYQRGGFVEAAALIEASPRVAFDFAAAVMKLGGPDDYDAEAAELRALATFRRRAMDLTLGARYALYDRESPFDEQVLELRMGASWPWMYPEGARY